MIVWWATSRALYGTVESSSLGFSSHCLMMSWPRGKREQEVLRLSSRTRGRERRSQKESIMRLSSSASKAESCRLKSFPIHWFPSKEALTASLRIKEVKDSHVYYDFSAGFLLELHINAKPINGMMECKAKNFSSHSIVSQNHKVLLDWLHSVVNHFEKTFNSASGRTRLSKLLFELPKTSRSVIC